MVLGVDDQAARSKFAGSPLNGSLFFWRNPMWKIAVGFIIFAGLALFMLSKGGDIDMGGEKHGADAVHAPEPAASSAK